jgi:hypothetical protein
MTIIPIRSPNLSTNFDEAKGIVLINYHGHHTPEIGGQAYQWARSLLEMVGPEAIRGVIFDFSDVDVFEETTFSLAKARHEGVNRVADMSHHPVAVVVATPYQEQMVSAVSMLTHSETRTALVNSCEEAMEFIETWHAELDEPE